VFSVVGYDGTATFPFPQGAWVHIETIRRAVCAVIREFCPPDESFVLTNVLDARAPGDKALFRRIERLAQQRQARFFPVWLTCEAAMLRQRKDTPERRARRKDSDVTTIAWWLQEFEVLRVPHRNALTLDTSHCGPEQTAQRIVEHVHGTEHGGRAATQSPTRDGAEQAPAADALQPRAVAFRRG
jgi:hypothetical protein